MQFVYFSHYQDVFSSIKPFVSGLSSHSEFSVTAVVHLQCSGYDSVGLNCRITDGKQQGKYD